MTTYPGHVDTLPAGTAVHVGRAGGILASLLSLVLGARTVSLSVAHPRVGYAETVAVVPAQEHVARNTAQRVGPLW